MGTANRMTLERLAEFGRAWRDKDLELLMSFMTEDCVFRASVGQDPGTTFCGRDEVRRGFELMLAYDAGAEQHVGNAFIQGDLGAAQWSFAYTDDDLGETVVAGCDLYEFEGDKIRVKDAYRKVKDDITTPTHN